MRKLLRLSLLTAVLTLVMSAAVWAEEITSGDQLTEGTTYTDIEISGEDVTVTVPAGGIYVNASSYDKPAINIKKGSNVTITGADGASIKYGSISNIKNFIIVEQGATLTLENIDIDGCSTAAAGKFYNGISNEGTLNINAGTKLHNFYLRSGARLGGAVYNVGDLNMTGGAIYNNGFTGGGGLFLISGKANISGGAIYGNSVYSIYHGATELSFTGGLVVGETYGRFNVSGEYKSGKIKLASNAGTGSITIEDKTDGVSVEAKNGDYFVANPAHNLVATIGGLEHTAIFYENEWHFFNAEHDDPGKEHEHEIIIEDKEVNMYLDEQKTIYVQILCTEGKHDVGFSISNDTGVVEVEKLNREAGSDTTAFTLTAKKVGKASILFKSEDGQSYEYVTVNVSDPNSIKGVNGDQKSMDTGKKYVNTTITNTGIREDIYGSNPMVVTVPTVGIEIGSTEGSNCITIEKGSVKLTGGTLTHKNDGNFNSRALIKVKSGATLVLENITIDGGWTKGKEATTDLLYYGIDNDGVVIIKSGTVIKGIDVETDIEDDAVLFNKGTLMIEGGAIHGNDNQSYVIYSNGGTVTVTGGVTVGKIPENQTINGNNQWGILGGNIGGTITANLGKDETLEFEANAGDYVMTGSNTKLISEDGREAKYIEATHRWDFTDALKAEVSFVRGTATQGSATGNFSKTHYTDINGKREESDDLSDTYSVSTGFYVENEDVNIDENGKAYVVFDILFPADKTVYFNTDNKVEFGGAVHKKGFDLKKTAVFEPDGGQNLTEARNSVYSNEIKGKYTIDAVEGDTLFGVIVDGVYAPDAIAYISTCTAEQYEKATGYEEVKGDNGETQIAVVSLELE